MKTIYITLICCILYFAAGGQTKNYYYSFRPSTSAMSNVLSSKGEIKLDVSRELFLGNKAEAEDLTFRDNFDNIIFSNWLLIADNHIGLSYTPFDCFSVGANFLVNNKFDVYILDEYDDWEPSERYLLDVQYETHTQILELFGSYHKPLNQHFNYEVRTGLALGNGSHTYKRTYIMDIESSFFPLSFDDHFKYKIFRYNVGLSAAYHYKVFSCVLQANMGYIHYYKLSALIYASAVYSQMVLPLVNNKNDFYIDPSLSIACNFKHWGFNFNCAYPYSTNDKKLIELKPTLGFGLNFKINCSTSKQE